MSKLMLGNIAPETTDDEIKDFLVKYGFPAYDAIEHYEGDGSRPSVMVTFNNLGAPELDKLKPRVHDIYWKQRKVSARVVLDSFG